MGDLGSIPGLGRSPGGGHGNLLQYFCLENPHGQRSLVGCSPWGCKELDMTKPSTAYMYKHVLSHSVMPNSLRPHGLHPTRLLCPWGFSREECWSGLPFPSPGDLPNPGIEPGSPALLADALTTELPENLKERQCQRMLKLPHSCTHLTC